MKYTDEQQAVIDCTDKYLTVNAFAGSGKTSTLVGYSLARPKDRILYMAFNSSVAAEARSRFPANVECRTSHSLAYATFGASYRHKLGNPKARDAVDFLVTVMTPSAMGKDKYFFAEHALRRVHSFFGSGSAEDFFASGQDEGVLNNPSGEAINYAAVTKAAQCLWVAMKDKSNNSIQMPHDGYLKLYQLSVPDLRRYDRILLDEAQDTNPCLLNIIQTQETGKVLVGDKHQNIYGFRKSINAMEMIDGTRLNLTSSFRFGARIADIANAILATFCGESVRLRGLSVDDSDIKTKCYLHRTNAGLFGRGVEIIDNKQRPHFVGGIHKYAFDSIVDTWRLSAGMKDIRDPFLRRFDNYAALESYAESVDDREIKSRMGIVKNFGASIPRYVDLLIQSDTTADQAHATLTTAHKAKGQEWDHVVLGDDFPDMMVGLLPRTPINAKAAGEDALDIEEANLAYVAATRAKKLLGVSQTMNSFLKWEDSTKTTD